MKHLILYMKRALSKGSGPAGTRAQHLCGDYVLIPRASLRSDPAVPVAEWSKRSDAQRGMPSGAVGSPQQ